MKDGFVKVAAGTPRIRVADCAYNAGEIIALMGQAAEQGVKVLVLPELGITGYTCGDLFLQDALLDGAEAALKRIIAETAGLDLLTAVGLPVRRGNKLYNCAAVLNRGRLLGVVPKSFIPNYGEFSEGRCFGPAPEDDRGWTVELAGQTVDFSTHRLFACETVPNLVVGVEICEDLWRADAPSRELANHGVTVILNLSASNDTAGKGAERRRLVAGQSACLTAGYVYACAGEGESTTDLVFGGHNMVAENGAILAERRFETGLTLSEIDVDQLVAQRRRTTTFADRCEEHFVRVPFRLEAGETALTRPVPANPFLPARAERQEYFEEILTIAALGLKKRLEHTRAAAAVIGLSGGLDSTLAILTTVKAFDLLGRDRKDILAVTMPCFGTTARTRSNAQVLAEELGTGFRTVDISAAVRQHFADIGHNMADHSVTFENAQARERTQVLMDVANQVGGLVIGTGDLSELALGWCTYNGDHMSMYAVNAGIPKTLMRHLVAHVAGQSGQGLAAVLRDILDTPVSPELLPPEGGEIAQRTEDLVGPYELHDFFLYYAVARGFAPRKVYRLALHALGGSYDRAVILKWLKSFYRRFFSQQFKRSCMPDGPKVGELSLSPRGDWRMPSDAVAALWLAELEGLA